MADLLDTLKNLDPTDATLWTDDGLPVIAVVQTLMSDTTITREAINKVALGLTKDTVKDYTVAPVATKGKKPVVVEAAIEEDSQEAIIAKLAELTASIEKAKEATEANETEIAKLVNESNVLNGKIIRKTPEEEFAEAVAEHLKSATKERMERAAKLAKFEELGLTFDDLKEMFPQLGRL